MYSKPAVLFLILSLLCLCCGKGERVESANEGDPAVTQNSEVSTPVVEMIDGVRYVHNAAPKWDGNAEIRLELVRKFGDFFKPFDLSLDQSGNIYVTDSGNHRVQKYSSDGEHLASFGRKGQGPGEFQMMGGVAVGSQGQMYVTDRATNRLKILSPQGDELENLSLTRITGEIELLNSGEFVLSKGLFFNEASLPGLILIVDESGTMLRTAGRQELSEDWDEYRYFNRTSFAVDGTKNLFVAYATRNRIEKYNSEGTLGLVMDRPLNFEISKEIAKIKRRVGPREMELPQLNFVSKALAIDDKDRIWVLSYDRQLTFEEQPVIIHFAGEGAGLEGTTTLKAGESVQTDAFVFHVFGKTGEFLGKIPLNHFADRVRIFRDRLYILETNNEMCVYEYRILESDE